MTHSKDFAALVPLARERLARLLLDRDPRVALRAAELVLAYGIGKPPTAERELGQLPVLGPYTQEEADAGGALAEEYAARTPYPKDN